MADRPIIFSGPMVRALLAGRKTQTRRVGPGVKLDDLDWSTIRTGTAKREHIKFPYAVGDRLWVRETFRGAAGYDDLSPAGFGNKPVWHEADGEPGENWWFLSKRAQPAIHMPRIYSRITLTVIDVRVQRLQEISEEDAEAEGVAPKLFGAEHGGEYRRAYITLWNTLNGARPGCSWSANPWVCAVTFTVQRGNIDQVAA